MPVVIAAYSIVHPVVRCLQPEPGFHRNQNLFLVCPVNLCLDALRNGHGEVFTLRYGLSGIGVSHIRVRRVCGGGVGAGASLAVQGGGSHVVHKPAAVRFKAHIAGHIHRSAVDLPVFLGSGGQIIGQLLERGRRILPILGLFFLDRGIVFCLSVRLVPVAVRVLVVLLVYLVLLVALVHLVL